MDNQTIYQKKQKNKKLIQSLIEGRTLTGIMAQLLIPKFRDAHAGLIRGSLVRTQPQEQLKKKWVIL